MIEDFWNRKLSMLSNIRRRRGLRKCFLFREHGLVGAGQTNENIIGEALKPNTIQYVEAAYDQWGHQARGLSEYPLGE